MCLRHYSALFQHLQPSQQPSSMAPGPSLFNTGPEVWRVTGLDWDLPAGSGHPGLSSRERAASLFSQVCPAVAPVPSLRALLLVSFSFNWKSNSRTLVFSGSLKEAGDPGSVPRGEARHHHVSNPVCQGNTDCSVSNRYCFTVCRGTCHSTVCNEENTMDFIPEKGSFQDGDHGGLKN